MSDWRIRTATEADAAALLGLWWEAGGRPSPTDDAASVERLMAKDPEALLIAEAGGEVVGTLIAAWDGWRGSFYKLTVDPAWRRRGVAIDLIRAGERRLEALGAVRLTAIVAEEHPAAVALWGAAGYQRQSQTARFVRMLEEG